MAIQVKGTYRDWTSTELDFLRENYPTKGWKFCATELKRSEDSIRRKADYLGVRMPRKQFRIESLKEITTPEVAYLFGLMWADGHVTKSPRLPNVSLTLVKKDLDEIKDLFIQTGEWTYSFIKRKKVSWQDCACLRSSNRDVWNLFVQDDYQTKSTSSPDKILSRIPEFLHHYWWRGYFDGDGCLWVSKRKIKRGAVTLSSHWEQDWSGHLKLMEKLKVTTYRIDRKIQKNGKHKSSSLHIQNNHDIEIFMSYIYQGREVDKIGLTRKYLKWKDFLSKEIIQKTSRFKGVCRVHGNRWKAYYKGRQSRWFKTQEDAFEARQGLIKKYGT